MYSGARSAPLGQTTVASSLSTLSLAKVDFSLSWLKTPPFKGTHDKSAVPYLTVAERYLHFVFANIFSAYDMKKHDIHSNGFMGFGDSPL